MDILIESWVVGYVFGKSRGLFVNRNPFRGITLEDRDVSQVDQRLVSLIELARSKRRYAYCHGKYKYILETLSRINGQ